MKTYETISLIGIFLFLGFVIVFKTVELLKKIKPRTSKETFFGNLTNWIKNEMAEFLQLIFVIPLILLCFAFREVYAKCYANDFWKVVSFIGLVFFVVEFFLKSLVESRGRTIQLPSDNDFEKALSNITESVGFYEPDAIKRAVFECNYQLELKHRTDSHFKSFDELQCFFDSLPNDYVDLFLGVLPDEYQIKLLYSKMEKSENEFSKNQKDNFFHIYKLLTK